MGRHEPPGGTFTGTRTLLRASIHQDARNIGPWVVLISVLSATSILGYRWLFPEVAERKEFALAITANPALALVFGKAGDLLTLDGFNAWRAGGLGAFFSALMAILIVIRNSRAGEDSGQAELIAAGVVTRQARLLVAVLMATIAAVALGVVCFLLTWVSGGAVLPTLVISVSFAASALLFAGVAAVAAQLGADARTASSLSIGLLGVAYLARGYIDSSRAPEWTRWLTPMGWVAQMRPSTENDFWPLLPILSVALLLVVIAQVLQQHRDFGLGMLTPRPGAAEARGLSIEGLALRMHRGPLLVWVVAFAFLGTAWGNLTTSVRSILEANPTMAVIMASGAVHPEQLTFAFVVTILQILGIIAAVIGAQVMMRVHTEELDRRVEPLLAAPLPRRRYYASNVLLALGATALVMLVAGTLIGIAGSRGDTGVTFGDVLIQALCTIPAVWVLVGVSVAVVGAEPSKRLAGWLVIVATFGITLLGPTFKFPDYLLGISPLYHVPNTVSAQSVWPSLFGLAGVVAFLLLVGFVGFRRRDLVST